MSSLGRLNMKDGVSIFCNYSQRSRLAAGLEVEKRPAQLQSPVIKLNLKLY